MAESIKKQGVTRHCRDAALGLIAVQSALFMLGSLFALFFGRFSYFSTLLGGFCVLFPAALFACVLFRTTSAAQAKKIVLTLYGGELGKLLSSAALALILTVVFKPSLIALWCGFMGAHASLWLAPVFANTDGLVGRPVV